MRAVFLNLLPVSVAVSILICVIFLLSKLLERRYTVKWRYFVWLVLALRLLIPWGAAIPVPVQTELAPAVQTAQIWELNPLGGAPANAALPDDPPHTMAAQDHGAPPIEPVIPHPKDPLAVLTMIWAAGASLCLLRYFCGYALLWRQVRRWGALCQDEWILKAANRIRRETGIRTKVPVVICKNASSPMVTGFFFPTLILPKIEYDPQDLRWILRHEFIHCKRRDIWYKLVVSLACSLHWFNPLVWCMAWAAVRDIEISCDNTVLSGACLEDRAKYCETILQAGQSGPRMAFTTQFYTGRQGLSQRLRAIFDTHPHRRGAAALTAVIFAAAISGGCLRPVPIPAAETNAAEHILYEPSETPGKVKKPASPAAMPDKVTETVAYFLGDNLPGTTIRSQVERTDGGWNYTSCRIFETENPEFLPDETASARINFIPETYFSAYRNDLLPLTSGEREIDCPLAGWRATASYRPECGIDLAKIMDRLMNGADSLDSSLRLPLELTSWYGAFELFSGDETSGALYPLTDDDEICAVILERFRDARPNSVSAALGKSGLYQLMNLYAQSSGGTWKGFSIRFYRAENAVDILALDGGFQKRYTFNKGDPWMASLLDDVAGRLAALPPAPALSAKAAAEKIASFAGSPELKLGALSGEPAETGWLPRKSDVNAARSMLLQIQPQAPAKCDPLSRRIAGLQLEKNHETIDMWLLDTPIPTVEYTVSGVLTPMGQCYTLTGGTKPFLTLMDYLHRTNQMFRDSSEKVRTEDTDPENLARLLFETYRNSHASDTVLEDVRLPDATVMGTRFIGGDLERFVVEIEYRDDLGQWGVETIHGRREAPKQYRLVKIVPETEYFPNWPEVDVATEHKKQRAVEFLQTPDPVRWNNQTDFYAASLLDGVLTGGGRLEGFLWQVAKNQPGSLQILAPPYIYEVWAPYDGAGCVIVYQADGSWTRYETAQPISATADGYLIGQGLSGPGLPLILPRS